MHLTDHHVNTLNEHGWVLIENFLNQSDLAAAQKALKSYYPSAEEYDAHPENYTHLQGDMFEGMTLFPFSERFLNNLPTHPDIVQIAERILNTKDLRFLRASIQAKFAGAADYEQMHHYDYPNHTLVVPNPQSKSSQFGFFLYLSDVTEDLGPTYFVSKKQAPKFNPATTHFFQDAEPAKTRYHFEHAPELYAHETPATGSAGSLLIYGTDTLHRGSAIKAKSGVRLTIGFAYGNINPWDGYQCWPRLGEELDFIAFLTQATPRQRDLFGFPPIGDPYWNEETLAGVQARYPEMNMTPYRTGQPK